MTHAGKVNEVPPSPPAIVTPLEAVDTSMVASPTSGPSAAQSSRRAKNAAHRANDAGRGTNFISQAVANTIDRVCVRDRQQFTDRSPEATEFARRTGQSDPGHEGRKG